MAFEEKIFGEEYEKTSNQLNFSGHDRVSARRFERTSPDTSEVAEAGRLPGIVASNYSCVSASKS
jgi:hypothetical protein